MARIRTIKPEAFQSETLGSVSVEAERTFLGLTTQADDRGRHRDNAAVINGLLWSLRPDHTPVQLETELGELERAGLICRYRGCDGKRYLHFVTWDQHQKIDRPSKSRQPKCPKHGTGDYCGRHTGECPPSSPRPDMDEPSRETRESSMQDRGPWTVDQRTVDQRERAGARKPDHPAPPPVQRPDGLTSIPDDFEPTDSMRRWAIATFGDGLDLDFETAQFAAHYRSTGARRRSWPDQWQKWVRDSAKRRSEQALRAASRASPGGVIDRRQQATDDLFDRALDRARALDAMEASHDP